MENNPELWQEILFLADWIWENGQKTEGLRDIDLFRDLSLNQIRILRTVQLLTFPLFIPPKYCTLFFFKKNFFLIGGKLLYDFVLYTNSNQS